MRVHVWCMCEGACVRVHVWCMCEGACVRVHVWCMESLAMASFLICIDTTFVYSRCISLILSMLVTATPMVSRCVNRASDGLGVCMVNFCEHTNMISAFNTFILLPHLLPIPPHLTPPHFLTPPPIPLFPTLLQRCARQALAVHGNQGKKVWLIDDVIVPSRVPVQWECT